MATKTTLATICNKFCSIQHNEDNYSVGGGLTSGKFASNRHEDAKYDEGKLTLGEATQLFKKATNMDTDSVREVLEFAVPNMEWHHAGKLPKQYGGGMKKTYFLNSQEICDVATNWESYCEKLKLTNQAAKVAAENKMNLEASKLEFLEANATKLTRVDSVEKWNLFYVIKWECNGKFGWFDASKNIYKLTEYATGWMFKSEEKYNEFKNLK